MVTKFSNSGNILLKLVEKIQIKTVILVSVFRNFIEIEDSKTNRRTVIFSNIRKTYKDRLSLYLFFFLKKMGIIFKTQKNDSINLKKF